MFKDWFITSKPFVRSRFVNTYFLFSVLHTSLLPTIGFGLFAITFCVQSYKAPTISVVVNVSSIVVIYARRRFIRLANELRYFPSSYMSVDLLLRKFSLSVALMASVFEVSRTLTYFVKGSITVSLTSCLTGLDSTKQVNMLLIQHQQSSWIQTKQTGGQP